MTRQAILSTKTGSYTNTVQLSVMPKGVVRITALVPPPPGVRIVRLSVIPGGARGLEGCPRMPAAAGARNEHLFPDAKSGIMPVDTEKKAGGHGEHPDTHPGLKPDTAPAASGARGRRRPRPRPAEKPSWIRTLPR